MKYEYNAIKNTTPLVGDRMLNKLGEEGWELVSHAYDPITLDHFYTFKREKVSTQDTPAIEDTIKNLDNRIKELEKKRSNSIMDIRLK